MFIIISVCDWVYGSIYKPYDQISLTELLHFSNKIQPSYIIENIFSIIKYTCKSCLCLDLKLYKEVFIGRKSRPINFINYK